MSSEQPKLNHSEDNNKTSGEPQAAPQQNVMASQPAPATQKPEADDPDEARAGGDVDFGQLLDQFEQEQATLEEGEVVRGTVVGITERGVLIDFGYKSEGIVNPAEFMHEDRRVACARSFDRATVARHFSFERFH